MMLEVTEMDDEQLYIDLRVQTPIKEAGNYVSYEIALETNDPSFSFQKSTTRRRYSEFVLLRKLLRKQFPPHKLPLLPPKDLFKDTFDLKLIKDRQEALQEFLRKLVADRLYLSSKALHLFLQSTFSLSKIKDIIEGKATVSEIQTSLSDFYNSFPPTEEDGSNSHCSSDCFSDESSSSACAIIKPSSESNMNSSLDHKKVSFCEQVTVAEVHTP